MPPTGHDRAVLRAIEQNRALSALSDRLLSDQLGVISYPTRSLKLLSAYLTGQKRAPKGLEFGDTGGIMGV